MNIEKILAGRKVVDDYRDAHGKLRHHVRDGRVLSIDHSEITGKMLPRLKALGFNSINEFMEANKGFVVADHTRCFRFEGECDFCEERERGCVWSCYKSVTELDSSSPTGRTKLVAGADVWATLNHFKDYYKDTFPKEIGEIYPIVPRCNIRHRMVATPSLDWFWGM